MAQSNPIIGQQYFVNPSGENSNSGLAPDSPFQTIQHALDVAQPGDTIHLSPSTFVEDIRTVRDGRADAPITIIGTSESIITGKANDRIFEVNHDYIHLHGFTIDGLKDDEDDDSPESYWSKLLYVVGQEAGAVTRGIRIIDMRFKNAGEECLRLRYFVQYSEVAYSTFENCGLYDFRFDQEGKVGEAIYIGTSSNQWDKNPSYEPDHTAYNWIHHNRFETFGNECIELKEGTLYNVVEYNICSQQQDKESAGIGSRGDENTIRYNEVYENVGAGIRLGGHEVNGVQYGRTNHVYGNTIYKNEQGGIKLETGEQGIVCGNTIFDNETGDTSGAFFDAVQPTMPCDPNILQTQPRPPFSPDFAAG